MSTTALSQEVIRQIPLFQGLSEEEANQLVAISQVMHFQPGEVILRQGGRSRNLWVVLEGTCEVTRHGTDGRDVVLATLEPYANFGEMSFFHAAPHSASVRAKSHVQLLRIGRNDYDRLVEQNSLAAYKLAYNTLDVLADRLRHMDQWVAQLLEEQSDGRMVCEWSQFRQTLFSEWNL